MKQFEALRGRSEVSLRQAEISTGGVFIQLIYSPIVRYGSGTVPMQGKVQSRKYGALCVSWGEDIYLRSEV